MVPASSLKEHIPILEYYGLQAPPLERCAVGLGPGECVF